jgi:hypothetical protein
MDITYCGKQCPIGKAASDLFLDINNSAIDAAFDFRSFINNCYIACPFKCKHRENNN